MSDKITYWAVHTAKMQEYEDGVEMTKISDIDNNPCSPNTDSMEF